MYFDHFSSVALKQVLVIILFNYVLKCYSFDITRAVSHFKDASDLKKLINLPENIGYNAKELFKNTSHLVHLKNEDIALNATQLIQKNGYKVEEHHVTTSDGYNLALFRIPGKGRAIFIMHGILSSFVDWLTVDRDQVLPFLLADLGYDIWLGNSRGNTFSRKNNHLSPNDPEFWDFSFNEVGSIDLPAMIDYVLKKTGKDKVTYIGHSQGTTSIFVLCSIKPEYNEKIDLIVALSPIAWMKHIPNPFVRLVYPNYEPIFNIGKALDFNEILPDNILKKAFTTTFCSNSFLASIVCQNVVFLVTGFDYLQTNYKQLPVIFKHFPAGSSLKEFEHYSQLIVSGDFRNYDYGAKKNLKKYGSVTPPSYPVEKISAPVAMFYSQGDWLASPIDVEHLRRKLKNVVDFYEVPFPNFNHVGFLWARDVKTLVYDRVLSLIKQN